MPSASEGVEVARRARPGRVAIMRTAIGLMGEQGYEGTSTRDIAARVEHVSQGTEELAASAQQTAAAASELAQVVAVMERLGSRFRLA